MTTTPQGVADQIVRTGKILAARRGIALSTLGRLTVGNSRLFNDLAQGRVTISRATRVVERLSDLWPADMPWPREITRPSCPRKRD